MGKADFYLPGAYNQICDRTGFKQKSTMTRREWTGQTVRIESWEPRHPQDLIRSVKDDQSVENPNPPAPDKFLATNEVSKDDL